MNRLKVNYYDEYQKYTGGNSDTYYINEKDSIASTSMFQIYGRSSHFSNINGWKNVFFNILNFNPTNLNTSNFSDSSKTIINNMKNNQNISSNSSFNTNLSYLFNRLIEDLENSTGLAITFEESNNLEDCLKRNKENSKNNKIIMKNYFQNVKKKFKIGTSGSLKNSKVFDNLVDLSKTQKALEKEGIDTKLNFIFNDTKIVKDSSDIDNLVILTVPKLEILLNSNILNITNKISEIEYSKVINVAKKRKLIKILNDFKTQFEIFNSKNNISLINLIKVIGNEKLQNNIFGIKELNNLALNTIIKTNSLEIKKDFNSGIELK